MSLAISPHSLERRRIDGGDLSYLIGGAGPALVLVHGLGGASGNWLELAPLLLPSYTILIPDLPGHGSSGRGREGATLASLASAVRVCAEAESIERPVVVGHSLGGQVALELATSAPGWVRAIVLAASSGISSARPGRRRALKISSLVRPARRVARLRPWIVRHRLTRRLTFSNWVSDIDTLTPAGADEFLAGAGSAPGMPSALEASLERDQRRELHCVTVPALILWGARDAALPVADGIEYARRLRAQLRVLADTGHLLIGERPEICARLIDEFVSEL